MRKIKPVSNPKSVNFEAISKEIGIICKKFNIDLLYLFGGAAKGTAGKLSDIDIAYYSENNLINKNILKLNQSFVELLNRDDVDLVDLKMANPYICFMAIKHGKLLFCLNSELCRSVETDIQKKFLDTIYLRSQFHAYQYNAVMKGGFYVSAR